MGSALPYYRNVTSRSHIDVREFEAHARLVIWACEIMGAGPGLSNLANGRGVLPVWPRFFDSRDLPFCLRIEFPTKALPAHRLNLMNEMFLSCNASRPLLTAS